MQPRLHIPRQLFRLALQIKLDRLFRLHHHQVAVLAFLEVLLQLVLHRCAQLAVNKI